MADDTVLVYDVEYVFHSGERLDFTFRPDRGDTKVLLEPVGVRYTLILSPTLQEEYLIEGADVSYLHTTARQVLKADLERQRLEEALAGAVLEA